MEREGGSGDVIGGWRSCLCFSIVYEYEYYRVISLKKSEGPVAISNVTLRDVAIAPDVSMHDNDRSLARDRP